MGRQIVAVQRDGRIRFLTVVSTLARGGTERAAVNYAIGYRRAGMESALLAYLGGGPRRGSLEREGVEIFVGGSDKEAQRQAIERARTWAPDILHVNRPGEPDPVSGSIVRSLSHPEIRTFETNVFGYVDDSADRALFDVHLQLSRWCYWKWNTGSRGLQGRAPGVVVPYSVDTSAFSVVRPEDRAKCRRQFGIPDDAVVFGRIGQPGRSKWSSVLIEAFRTTASAFPNAWLLLVGLPAEMQQDVDRLPKQIRLRVKQLPMVDSDRDLRAIYSSMDVFAHASEKGESFGMVLCEAMLCGLPVITLSTPLRDNSQIEVVRHGRTGLVVSDQASYGSAMADLCGNAARRQELGRNGPGWVREQYDIATVTERIVELARISLAAASSDELQLSLAHDPRFTAETNAATAAAIFKSAGLRSTFLSSAIPSLVNQHLARRLIRLARAVQRKFSG